MSPAMAGGFFNTDPPGKPQVMILNFVVAAYFIYSVDSGELWASLIAQLVKNPPAMKWTPVQFLGREDLLEKG